MDAAGDRHPVVAVFLGGRLSVDVTELRAAERRMPRHLNKKNKIKYNFILLTLEKKCVCVCQAEILSYFIMVLWKFNSSIMCSNQ